MKKLIALLLAAALRLATMARRKIQIIRRDRTRKIHRMRTSRQKQRRRETELPYTEELMGDYTRENYHAELDK